MESICRLCGQPKKLVKAHIIPDFMYGELFDQKHRIKQVSFESNVFKGITPRETGEFYKSILCEKCDNEILGSYEAYAKRAFYGGTMLTLSKEPERMFNKTWMQVGNIDYKKFKLFLLSILWRASITKGPYFRQVNLDKHENIIRDMMLNGDPGKKEDYPTLIIHARSFSNQIISQPKLVGKMEDKIFTFLIAGGIFIFFIETNNIPDYLYETTINEKNEMKILLTDKTNAANLISLNLFK